VGQWRLAAQAHSSVPAAAMLDAEVVIVPEMIKAS
jgi:hypothetical protein